MVLARKCTDTYHFQALTLEYFLNIIRFIHIVLTQLSIFEFKYKKAVAQKTRRFFQSGFGDPFDDSLIFRYATESLCE